MSSGLRLVGLCVATAAALILGPASLGFAHGGGGGGGHGGGGGGGFHGGGGGGGFHGGGGGGWGGHSFGGGWGGGGFGGGHAVYGGFGGGHAIYGSGIGGAYSHGLAGGYGHGNLANYGGQWWHNGGNWNRYNGFGYGRYGYGGYGFWPYGWFPWSGLGGWSGYYGYDPYYYDSYGVPGYGYDSYVAGYEPGVYTAAYAPAAAETSAVPEDSLLTANGEQGTVGQQYLAGARDAFRQGNYRDAMRLAGHAAVETPQNADVHDLLMLAMFAEGDYRGATMEAHAAASLGQPMNWDTLYGYYGDVKPYTEQLRNLEKDVAAHPADPGARFLLGYQYLMMGHNDAAKTELTKSLLQAPKDRLAAKLLVQIGGTVPESVLAVQRQMEKDMQRAVATTPAK